MGRIASMGFIQHFSDSKADAFVVLMVDLSRDELKEIMAKTKDIGERRHVVLPEEETGFEMKS